MNPHEDEVDKEEEEVSHRQPAEVEVEEGAGAEQAPPAQDVQSGQVPWVGGVGL